MSPLSEGSSAYSLLKYSWLIWVVVEVSGGSDGGK